MAAMPQHRYRADTAPPMVDIIDTEEDNQMEEDACPRKADTVVFVVETTITVWHNSHYLRRQWTPPPLIPLPPRGLSG